MAQRPMVGAGAPTATHSTTASHVSQHAHVMHLTAHTHSARVRQPRAHKMHKPRRTMRDSLLHISNREVWQNKGRASGQR
jgi:hypothetical protein